MPLPRPTGALGHACVAFEAPAEFAVAARLTAHAQLTTVRVGTVP
jgi:hypothetical protein